MKWTSVAVALMGVLLATGAQASSCDEATSQAAMNECAGRSFRQADEELNRLYQALVASLKDDAQARSKLVEAQRDWIRFRDSECGFQGLKAEGGSAGAMVLNMCREQHSRLRADSLRGYLQCKEGELYCPPSDR